MGRLIWLVLGFIGGVVVSRNAAAMPAPAAAAVILGAVVGCGICWWAAYRGKSQAVAVAVAEATAIAAADADARAAAIAQAAVHLHLEQRGAHELASVDTWTPAVASGAAAGASVSAPAPPDALPASVLDRLRDY